LPSSSLLEGSQPADILIVDDNHDNLALLRDILQRQGHKVRPATSGELAIRAALARPPDLILLDVRLPGLDGYATCVELRAAEATRDIPVIFISALDQAEHKLEGFRAGGVDYISKPFDDAEVVARVNTQLRLHRLQQDLEEQVRRRTVELEQALQDLRGSNMRHEMCQQIASLGHWNLDPGSYALTLSAQVSRIFELPQARGTHSLGTLFSRVHPEDRGRVEASIELALSTQRPQETVHRITMPDGRTKHVRQRCRMINGQSPHNHLLGTVQDITALVEAEQERAALEAQLRHAQKMEALGTLAGGIAHDFNNILSAIFGYTEMLSDLEQDNPEAMQDLTDIHRAATRARDLVRQILTFTRQSESQTHPIAVQLVVKETLNLLRASIPTTIAIRADIDMDCPHVAADAVHIHQVMMNLCTNAYQAMAPQAGTLTVSLRPLLVEDGEAGPVDPGWYTHLVVEDTGSGMPPDVRERALEPYFTTKQPGEGTGLGLAIVHGIVTGVGGLLRIYSEPGVGSSFHVFLPAATDEHRDAPSKEEGPHGGNERIMVVDDERPLTQLCARYLRKLGYRVTSHEDSSMALDHFQDDPSAWDLVLTDLTMPGLTGTELADAMHALRPELPIVLCTGFLDQLEREQRQGGRFAGYESKPLLIRKLAATIRRALDAAAPAGS
jgi:DNA-binding response OmpR family regulator/nitrogen-specific signal transduction histidine kinase